MSEDEVVIELDFPKVPTQLTGCSARELLELDLPEVQWIVPGLLPEGLTILAGKPKAGKSWLALDVAVAVTSGGECLGRSVVPGDVLYLALEDNIRRLQGRLGKILAGRNPSDRLRFDTVWPRLHAGGIDKIRDWLDGQVEPRLVIVDTLAKVRAPSRSRQSYDYADDYKAIEPLKAEADARGLGVLVVHHQRKQDAEDPIDTVSGTTGLTGAADTILVLTKDRLEGRGRDLEQDANVPVRFDPKTARWAAETDQIELVDSPTPTETPEHRAAQWASANLKPGAPLRAPDLRALGLSKRQAEKALKRLAADGLTEKGGPGHPAIWLGHA